MIRDITIGQYYPQESIVHRLDPRTKLMGTLIYVMVLFLVKNPLWFLPIAALTVLLYHLARIPISFFLKGLRGIILLMIFTFFFRMVCTPGTVVAQIWIFEITAEGIQKGIQMTFRIALMIIGASLLSYTSTPRELSDGLEKGLGFLEKIHIPIHSMAVIVMIAFRFIPIMIEEVNVLMDAQAARGAEFEDCSVWKKTKNVCSLLLPLFMSSVRRAVDLAMAMEARGYREGQPVTRMYPMVYTKNDKKAYLLMGAYLILAVGIKFI